VHHAITIADELIAREWVKVKTAAWRSANAVRGEMFEKPKGPQFVRLPYHC
jgi:hypothetical protein